MQITYILMVMIGLVTYFAWQRPEWHKRLMLNPYLTVHNRQYYRLLTSGFVHNNSMHLFLNLFTLYFFGLAIEQIFYTYFGDLGLALYVILFISAIAVANWPTTLKHKHNPGYNSLGASGGVSALVLAFILFDPVRDLCLYAIICLPGYILGGLFIAYSVIMSKRNADNINHDAHLFGALYGMIFTLILRPSTLSSFIEAIF
ncbi:MAG: rhomboid family intramembrane serine protease [Cytophagales bacterium CG12_big_fil_rev_8_21_14_0_65_40_12]|nr:MAG: rhomboid family intramembrane serine protease [Cytophagales bacterium CG12_big_fil_rev_8_21_14_0_65_40_12]PIW04390.1 MAG: rhomboid family intramembrane serine protease [Cytophagales bacterium CG17_big_fil_post_rev_8_21_14_2_50_40_13]